MGRGGICFASKPAGQQEGADDAHGSFQKQAIMPGIRFQQVACLQRSQPCNGCQRRWKNHGPGIARETGACRRTDQCGIMQDEKKGLEQADGPAHGHDGSDLHGDSDGDNPCDQGKKIPIKQGVRFSAGKEKAAGAVAKGPQVGAKREGLDQGDDGLPCGAQNDFEGGRHGRNADQERRQQHRRPVDTLKKQVSKSGGILLAFGKEEQTAIVIMGTMPINKILIRMAQLTKVFKQSGLILMPAPKKAHVRLLIVLMAYVLVQKLQIRGHGMMMF